MKTLQESMFDTDLLSREFQLDPDFIWNELIADKLFGKIFNECHRAGWLATMNEDTIKITKYFPYKAHTDLNTKVTLVICLGADDYVLAPMVRLMKLYGDQLLSCSDNRLSTKLCVTKGFEFKEGKFGQKYFKCDSNTIIKIIDFLKRVVEKMISKDMDKIIQDRINWWGDKNKPVPGLIIDQTIMKKLINEA